MVNEQTAVASGFVISVHVYCRRPRLLAQPVFAVSFLLYISISFYFDIEMQRRFVANSHTICIPSRRAGLAYFYVVGYIDLRFEYQLYFNDINHKINTFFNH